MADSFLIPRILEFFCIKNIRSKKRQKKNQNVICVNSHIGGKIHLFIFSFDFSWILWRFYEIIVRELTRTVKGCLREWKGHCRGPFQSRNSSALGLTLSRSIFVACFTSVKSFIRQIFSSFRIKTNYWIPDHWGLSLDHKIFMSWPRPDLPKSRQVFLNRLFWGPYFRQEPTDQDKKTGNRPCDWFYSRPASSLSTLSRSKNL